MLSPNNSSRNEEPVASGWMIHFYNMSDSLKLIICTVIGCIVGVTVQMSDPSEEVISWLSFPGVIFLRVLKCLVIPLIFCNMAVSVTDMCQLGNTGKIGLRAFSLFMTTTLCAAVTGVGYTLMFYQFYAEDTENSSKVSTVAVEAQSLSEVIQGVFMSMFTDNISKAASTPDILSIIVFACFFGYVVDKISLAVGETNQILHLLEQLTRVFNYWISMVLKLAPLAVLFMIAGSFAGTNDFKTLFANVGILVATCLSGFVTHTLVMLPLLFFCLVRRNPYIYQQKCISAYTFAFGSASSAATLPVSMKCLADMEEVPDAVMRFVLSLGATINMDGSAIYFPAAIVFMAVVSGNSVLITPASIFTLLLMSTVGAVGASPIPNAGLVMIVTIWDTVFPGVPVPPQIAYVTAIDWLLDRFVTVTNVCGDTMIAQMVAATVAPNAISKEEGKAIETSIINRENKITEISRTHHSHIMQPRYSNEVLKKKSLKLQFSAPTPRNMSYNNETPRSVSINGVDIDLVNAQNAPPTYNDINITVDPPTPSACIPTTTVEELPVATDNLIV